MRDRLGTSERQRAWLAHAFETGTAIAIFPPAIIFVIGAGPLWAFTGFSE
jgi:hypothetical protein